MRVLDIIKTKGSHVVTLTPDATISDVVATLAQHGIGAVVIVSDDEPVGIVSERDVVRHLAHSGDAASPVALIMTTTLATCSMEDELTTLATVMTERRIRHLPVVDGTRLAAIVSIGDVVKARLDDLEAERDHLKGYLHG